jgi:hypothetical protein
MNSRAKLLLTVIVATTVCAGVAWSQSPTAKPIDDWARYSLIAQRLETVAYRISVRNAELCPNANTRVLGLVPTLSDPALNDYAEEAGPLTISWVVPGSPAAGSGLRKGDRILDIDGDQLPSGSGALEQLIDRLLDRSKSVVSLGIERARSRSRVTVRPTSACNYKVALFPSEDVNAFTRQRYVVITEGMLALLPRDEQLAVVVGHEFGHILAGHTEGEVDPSLSSDRELQADYLGIYLAARAGYDVSGAKEVLQRIAAAHNRNGEYMSDIAQRLRAIETAIGEIDAKRSHGQSLLPSE